MEPGTRPARDRNIAPAWISEPIVDDPVILSTRLRLARNLDHYPFPHQADDSTLARIAADVDQALQDKTSRSFRTLSTVDVSGSTDPEKAALVDSHLVSLMHVTAGPHRIALIDENHKVSIMVNEEDHIRIQTIFPGFMPDAAWHEADRLDDALSKRLNIAFHETYGYLTASLANTGTGMRLSMMAHLPGLAFLEKLSGTWQAARALNTTVRGLYGEGGDHHGDVYQFSNSMTVGQTEKQIVGIMKAVAFFLLAEEESARSVIQKVRMNDVREQVQNALEHLKTATALTPAEAMTLLSTLRLGEMLGVKTYVGHRMFCEMLASMRGSIGLIVSKKNRARDMFYEDTRRPALIRNRLRLERAMVTKTMPAAADSSSRT